MADNTDITSLPEKVREFGAFVDGKIQPALSGHTTILNSPAHDVPVTECARCSEDDVNIA